jgi:stage II sporulation protein D
VKNIIKLSTRGISSFFLFTGFFVRLINAHTEQKKPCLTPTITKSQNSSINIIRVLLSEFKSNDFRTFIIKSKQGFFIESPQKAWQKKRISQKELSIAIKNKNLYLLFNNKKHYRLKQNQITINPLDHELYVNNTSYQGSLEIKIDKNNDSYQLINKLRLDDYIYSVLRFESLSYWPLEMQKVQAVISRTYALYQMRKTRKNKNSNIMNYDIKNSNFHQVYNGNHRYTHLREAIRTTHNQILTYKKAIALTMFDICCGGIIPSNMKKKDKDKPYLFRNYKCLYCKGKNAFTWQKKFSQKDFLSIFKSNPNITKKIVSFKRINSVGVQNKDKAGIVYSIAINGDKKNIAIINGKEIKKSIQKDLKSLAFSIQNNENSITLNGHGYGHNLGLCQLGARELVTQGWNYKQILQFYYPKTILAKLKE